MKREAQFHADPSSVTTARRFIAGSLIDVPDDAADAVALIASELASNSIGHAGSPYRIRIERLPDHVRLEVEDDGDGRPIMKSPSIADTSGRGLQIVAALADEWGVEPVPDSTGKIVWATIALHASKAEQEGGRESGGSERERAGDTGVCPRTPGFGRCGTTRPCSACDPPIGVVADAASRSRL